MVESSGEFVEVAIFGDLTIRGVDSLHEKLSAAVENHHEIVLNIDPAAEADLTFVQLIEAARRSVSQRGKSLRLSGPADGALRAVLERGGFLGDADPTGFWLNGAISA